MTTVEDEGPLTVRGAGPARRPVQGRDAVLALGLLGTAVVGVAAFLKAVSADGVRLPMAPVVALALLLLGVLLARWSLAPARRRRRTPPPDGSAEAPSPADLPDLAGEALDHAAADADGFEHTVAALCARDGCTAVEVVGGAGDLGADVVATAADGRRVVIQCKHYAQDNRVGSQDLQRFGGTCFAVHEADVAVLVTTSSFTAPAAAYADTCGIVRIDGEALAAWTEQETPPPWEPGASVPAPAQRGSAGT